MLVMGAPAGWSFLIMSAGICVLLAQWALVREIRFEVPDATMVALGIAGIVCVGVAVVYLTRAADDLPSVFPGYDRDSENFRLLPGSLSLIVGAVRSRERSPACTPVVRTIDAVARRFEGVLARTTNHRSRHDGVGVHRCTEDV